MRIGIILTGFNMEEYVESCLSAWLEARRSNLGGHEFVICAVSVPFAGFPNTIEDNTTSLLFDQMSIGNIDHLVDGPRNIPETTARGMALQWLKERGVDILWQVDLDEMYTVSDINNILTFVKSNPFIAFYRVSLKNYVFDTNTYLTEPFTPARIHRVIYGNLEISGFWADNNAHYNHGGTRDTELSCLTVPPLVAWIKHLTWQNDLRSKDKVEYQQLRWGTCSFKWDNVEGLSFDEDYYRQRGIMVPNLVYTEVSCRAKDPVS